MIMVPACKCFARRCETSHAKSPFYKRLAVRLLWLLGVGILQIVLYSLSTAALVGLLLYPVLTKFFVDKFGSFVARKCATSSKGSCRKEVSFIWPTTVL